MPPSAHIRLVVHPARRAPGHTDWPGTPELPVPSIAELVDAAAARRPEGITWLSGGEPTLRPDLPRLVEALAEAGHTVGLDTDGLAVTKPSVLAGLKRSGLRWVRLPLHSLIGEAHDWIEGTRGAAKRIRRAASAARSADLALSGSILVTRSTVPHLVDTVRALAAIGARHIHLRRPRQRGPAGRVFVTVSPRLGLAEPYLEAAVARGRDAGAAMVLDGFPRCAVPRVRRTVLEGHRDPFVVPPSLAEALASLDAVPAAPPCARCPGLPACAGPPADYVERFGRLELDDPGLSSTERVQPGPLVFGETPAEPPAREGRSPATRLRFAIRQAATPDLGGDPTAGMDRNPRRPLQLSLSGPTRAVRVEMVRLAQESTEPLRVDGGADLLRPEAHSLLRELLRLGFSAVHVGGDLSALGRRSKRSLARLQGIQRFAAWLWHPEAEVHDALTGPGHHASQLEALDKLAAGTKADTTVVALLPVRPGPNVLAPWTGAWGPGRLPGLPAFHFPEAPDAEAWASVLEGAPTDLASSLRSALESPRPTQ